MELFQTQCRGSLWETEWNTYIGFPVHFELNCWTEIYYTWIWISCSFEMGVWGVGGKGGVTVCASRRTREEIDSCENSLSFSSCFQFIISTVMHFTYSQVKAHFFSSFFLGGGGGGGGGSWGGGRVSRHHCTLNFTWLLGYSWYPCLKENDSFSSCGPLSLCWALLIHAPNLRRAWDYK